MFIFVLAWQHLARVKGTQVLSGGGMVDVPPVLTTTYYVMPRFLPSHRRM